MSPTIILCCRNSNRHSSIIYSLYSSRYFHANASNVDFGTDVTRVRINEYVEKFTKHKIKALLKSGKIIYVPPLSFGAVYADS